MKYDMFYPYIDRVKDVLDIIGAIEEINSILKRNALDELDYTFAVKTYNRLIGVREKTIVEEVFGDEVEWEY